jgi:hypothetical protein
MCERVWTLPGFFGDKLSLLAELQVSIERAASVLDRIAALNHDQKRTLRKMNGGAHAQKTVK